MTDISAARAHLTDLVAAGMTYAAIAAAAGRCGPDTISRLYRGLQSGASPRTAAAILAVPVPAPGPLVPALGSARRLQALVADGHMVNNLAPLVGLIRPAVTRLLDGRTDATTEAAGNRIAAVFEALADSPGPSAACRKRGRRNSWAGCAAWVGLDIDDPDESPASPGGVVDDLAIARVLAGGHADLTRPERVAAARILNIHHRLSPTRAGARIGVTPRTIWRWKAHGWTGRTVPVPDRERVAA